MLDRDIITVAGDISLSDRIIIGKYYGDVDHRITEENFPHNPLSVGEWEWRLFYFGRNISSEPAISAIYAAGWQPAWIEHLLAFGSKFPEHQRRYPIIALGSHLGTDDDIGDDFYVAGLYGSLNRSLNLYDGNDVWCEDFRFLAVRKMRDLHN